MSYQIDQGNICFATSVDREKVRKEEDVGVYTRICSLFSFHKKQMRLASICISSSSQETTMSTTRQRLTPTISVLSCCIGGSRCETSPYVLCIWQGRLLFISFVSFVKRKSDTPFHDFLPSSHPLCSSSFVLIYFSSRHQISKSIYEKKKQSWYWEQGGAITSHVTKLCSSERKMIFIPNCYATSNFSGYGYWRLIIFENPEYM